MSAIKEEFPGLTEIVSCIPGPGVDEDEFYCVPKGCDCASRCLDQRTCECLRRSASAVSGEENTDFYYAAFECNADCNCDDRCPNKTSQRGPLAGLKVAQSGTKGFGVFTDCAIPRGVFVCEYAGEVIGEEEARQRLRDQRQNDNYILVLREHFGRGGTSTSSITHQPPQIVTTVVDPTSFGNVGRFVNHSCDPNLRVVPLRSRSLIPFPALFSQRNIDPGEELTYDYSSTSGGRQFSSAGEDNSSRAGVSSKPCQCGSALCRKYLPSDPNVLI